MLILTKDKGSDDRMPKCSDGRGKVHLNCAFVTFSPLPFGFNTANSICQVVIYPYGDVHKKNISK